MLVLDTSALITILDNEPERRFFNELIETEGDIAISAANLLEARIVMLARWGDSDVLALDAFLHKTGTTVMAVSPRVADIAFNAYRQFGKGTGHGAALNFGDCFAYALAKHLDVPFLFKGDDFAKTDIRSAAEFASSGATHWVHSRV